MAKKKPSSAKFLKKQEFSKTLLVQESALIWIVTLGAFYLAFYCIKNQYFGELPWIVALVGFPWTAYGVSQACYYGKSMKENTVGGIKYETALKPTSEEEEYQKKVAQEAGEKIYD
jgi:hypothetical protein